MFDYEEIRQAVLNRLDFLPEDEAVRAAFFEGLLRLLMYP